MIKEEKPAALQRIYTLKKCEAQLKIKRNYEVIST